MKKQLLSVLLTLSMLLGTTAPAGATLSSSGEADASDTQSSSLPQADEEGKTAPPEVGEDGAEDGYDSVLVTENLETSVEETIIPDDSEQPDKIRAMDNDQLFDLYLSNLFDLKGDYETSLTADYGHDKFTEGSVKRQIYDALRNYIYQVAAGDKSATEELVIKTPAFVQDDFDNMPTIKDESKPDQVLKPKGEIIGEITEGTWKKDMALNGDLSTEIVSLFNSMNLWKEASATQRAGVDIGNVVDCLLVDCPAEMYWFNKTAGYQVGYSASLMQKDANTCDVYIPYLTISFNVAEGYQDNGNVYQVNATKATKAQAAINNANDIAAATGKTDPYEILTYFKEEICRLVEYNDDAANNNTPYGDPWQLVYVFDNDTTTKVVCEGYSKAFQYLCDHNNALKAEVRCITVTGTMDGGAHMWNIIQTKDGKCYHVDVTNSDDVSAGSSGELFLKAPKAGGSVATSYVFTTGGGDTGYQEKDITYVYDNDTKALYDESFLQLEATDYPVPVIKQEATATVTVNDKAITDASTSVDVTYGEELTVAVSDITAKASKAAATDGTVSLVNTDGKTIATAEVTSSSTTIDYETVNKNLTIGNNTLSVEYSGNDDLAKSTLATFTVNLAKNKVAPSIKTGESLDVTYNGTDKFEVSDKTELDKLSITAVAGEKVGDTTITELPVASAAVTLANDDNKNVGNHNNATLTATLDDTLNQYYEVFGTVAVEVIPCPVEVSFVGTLNSVKIGKPIDINITVTGLPMQGADPNVKLYATINPDGSNQNEEVTLTLNRDGEKATYTGKYTNQNLAIGDEVEFELQLSPEEGGTASNYNLPANVKHSVTIADKDSATAEVTAPATVTYGDVLTVEVSGITAGTQSIAKVRGITAPAANKVSLYLEDGTLLKGDVDISSGSATLTYDTKGKALKVGDHHLVVAYGGNDDFNPSTELGKATVKLEPKELGFDTLDKTYDGTTYNDTITPTGVLDGDEVTATVETKSADAGTYSVENGLTVNLTSSKGDNGYYSIPKSLTFTIKQAQLTLDPSDIKLDPKTYNGENAGPVSSIVLKSNGAEVALVKGTDYDVTAEYNDPNAGENKTATVTVMLKDGATKNYIAPAPVTLENLTISKAEALTGLTAEVTVKRGNEKKFDISSVNYGEDITTGEVQITNVEAVKTDGLKSAAADSSDKKMLVLTAKNDINDFSIKDTVNVTASMQNYKDSVIAVTVSYSDKTELTISGITLTGKVYDGNKLEYNKNGVSVAGLDDGVPFNKDTLEYKWYDSNDTAVADPVDAGKYTLKVTVPSSNPDYRGELPLKAEITPAPVTVKAKNKLIHVGNPEPTLDNVNGYTVTGLLNGVKLDSVSLSYANKPDTSKAGQIEIVVTAILNNTNYKLEPVNGILYIRQPGAIQFRDQRWADDVDKNAKTFYYNISEPKFTITGTGDNDTVEYILRNTPIAAPDTITTGWQTYTGAVTVSDSEAYIAAKITSDGSTYYLTSPKLKLFETTPVITGVTNGAIYCAAPTITVTNAGTVTVNDAPVTLGSKSQYTLQPTGKQTITATDEAGNKVSVTVTVNNGHSFETQTVESSCVNGNITKKTCKVCGYEETESLGTGEHKWGSDLTIDKAPTCTEPGSKSYHCLNCSATKDAVEIPATRHKKGTEWKADSTNHWHSCTDCGAVLDSAKHLESDWVTESNGTTQKKTCVTCQKEVSQREIIPEASTGDTTTTVEAQTAVEAGAPETAVQTSAKELWEKVLPEEVKQPTDEQKQFDVDIKVNLEVKPVAATSEAVKPDIDAIYSAAINADVKVNDITFMDISLSATKTVDGIKGLSESIKIEKTVNPLSITITIPDNLRNFKDNIKRTFSVFRYHAGESAQQVQGNYVEATGKFTFVTDKFSTYAIAYKDETVSEKPVNPGPGTNPAPSNPSGGNSSNAEQYVGGGNHASSGGGSYGGSSGGSYTGPATTPAVQGTTISVAAKESEGKSKADVNKTTADNLVDNAAKDNSKSVNVQVSAPADAASVTATIPSSSAKNLADKTNSVLNIETPLATVVIPNGAVGELAGKGKNTVGVTVEKSGDDVKITIQADSEDIGALSGVKASVPTDKTGSGNVAVIVNPDGTESVVKKAMIKDGKIVVPIGGSATVRIADRSKAFDDTQGHWANDSIGFVTSRELFNGISDTEFAPNAKMTRAMLVTVLHRLEDNPASSKNNFADVPSDAWFTDAVAWAAANGIVNGKTDDNFAPNDPITREQLAAILYRYANDLGLDTSVSDSLDSFSDADNVSHYATEAVSWAVGAGIINGKTSTTIAPHGDATRAEVSTMLMRLVGVMNTDTSVNNTDAHA